MLLPLFKFANIFQLVFANTNAKHFHDTQGTSPLLYLTIN
jgi:hypothetical protein